MHRQIFGMAVATLLAIVPGLASAQTFEAVQQTIQISPGGGPIQFPGLGGPRQFKTGTGRIRGRVLAAENGGPIRRAQVRITGQDIAPKAALTDTEGRFEFRDLPAGRFNVQASKSGFMSVQYGQTRPFESGKPIELLDKQMLDNADLRMPRGGVISGRVTDEFGDAIPDASVTAMRLSWSNGRRRLTPAPGRIAQTNDLGQFRIYGLPPGEYYVSASMRGSAMEMMDLEVMISGSVAEGPSASTPKSGYAATYYPGTPNASEAQRISVGVGQEVTSADFGLVPVRLARISGIVISADGKPLEGTAITAAPASREFTAPVGLGGTRTGKDGSFTLNGVPPGDYILQARSVQVITSTQGDNMMVFRATAMGGGGESEYGSTPLTVAGEDISNIVLTTSKGGTAVGQVTFDGPRPPSLTSFRIMSMAADAEMPSFGGMASVKEEGTFELKGLSGTRVIRVGSAPPGWMLKSVRLSGTDITDTGAEFKPGETTSGLEIELTQKSTTVTARVTSADGALLKDYTLVIFSESPEHWRYPGTRWVSGSRPDQDGRAKVQNLPAGTYYAVAVDYLPTGEWGDPEILERLKDKGRRFTLAEGATQNLDLKLTREY